MPYCPYSTGNPGNPSALASTLAVLCHIIRTLQFMGQFPNDFHTLPAVEQIALLPDWVQFLFGEGEWRPLERFAHVQGCGKL